MANLKAPIPPPKWAHTPESIVSLTKEAIGKTKALQDSIGALDPKDCNFKSVFRALAHGDALLESAEPLTFYQNVSPSKEVRDAANEAQQLLAAFAVEVEMRIDVYRAQKAAEKNIDKKDLDDEDKRLMERMLLDGKRAGLDLGEKEREELTTLKKDLSQLCVEFHKNFNEEKGTVAFTLEELKGVPQDVVSGYTKTDDGKYAVTFKTPDIFPLFKYAQDPETRKRAHHAYESRLTINVPLLDRILALRVQVAELLGYPTWADYAVENKMIKTSKAVFDFLDDLQLKLKPVGIKDRETLLALKKEEHEELGLPYDGEFYIWDYRYYDRKFVEKSLDLDDSLVKEYFPVDVVVPTILSIYEGLLGVEFVEVKNPVTWHEDAKQYEVWEAHSKDQSGFLGYTHLDLFPRESKYSHAAVWPLVAGYETESGGFNYPVSAMVANLAKPTAERKALMRHDDVVTFFHEMGHVFHGVLSKTKYGRFHGTSVARDFVEAPSQMLENWCWEPKVLKKMSSHYERKEPLSDELINKLIKSRYVNVGLFFLRQVFFAKFDIQVHTNKSPNINYTELWNNLRESISLVKSTKEGQPGQGTFGHITGGYDAGYYSYAYSLVFAADMYQTVFKKDPLDPVAGKRYRDKILRPGASRDELVSLEDFLGRKPNSDAFLKNLFGDKPTASL